MTKSAIKMCVVSFLLAAVTLAALSLLLLAASWLLGRFLLLLASSHEQVQWKRCFLLLFLDWSMRNTADGFVRLNNLVLTATRRVCLLGVRDQRDKLRNSRLKLVHEAELRALAWVERWASWAGLLQDLVNL